MKRLLMIVTLCSVILSACGGRRDGGNNEPTKPAAAASTVAPAPANTASPTVAAQPLLPINPAGLPSIPQTLKKFEVKNSKQRQAVCNDGSPAVYYFRAGSGAGATRWIIFFEGGGACSNDADCLERWKTDRSKMSSDGYNASIEGDGIFLGNDSQNQDFARFNVVHVKYCSSDTFQRDVEQKMGNMTFQFRGFKIVNAIIEDLQDAAVIPSPNLKNATDVLIGGGSAGAFGAQNHLDRLAGMLTWARVKGVLDSSWKPPVQNYSGASSVDQLKKTDLATLDVAKMVGDTEKDSSPETTGNVDETCGANPPSGKRNLCNFSYFLYPFITTPVFIYVSQKDEHHTEGKGITNPKEPSQAAWLTEYARLSRQSLELAKVTNIFAPISNDHTALRHTERFFKTKIKGVTFAEAFGAWYYGRQAQVKLIEEP